MKYIDAFLDRMTMYRLLEYYLLVLLGAAMVFGAFGGLAYNPFQIAGSVTVLVVVCWLTNYIFAKVYRAPSNPESSIITGLILALIITPPASLTVVPFLIAAAGLAIASKYLLAIDHKHIFNPVAIAVVLTAFGPQETASWWVGTAVLMPFVVIGGLLVVRKIRRVKMVSLFFGVALAVAVLLALVTHKAIGSTIQTTIFSSSLLFLGFVMLTEPLTSPSIWAKQRWYALVVGLCFAPQLHIGSLYSTPELALVIGNLLSFLMTPRVKTLLRLRDRITYGSNSEDVLFVPEKKFAYKPGQYIELTLPHSQADNRGSRRYFTIASSPTEDMLRVGIRYYDQGSSFKQVLQTADRDLFVSAGQLGGDFTLPGDPHQKLAFIAGGIGITPFRSMVKYLIDTHDSRSVTVLYGERSLRDIAYSDIFEAARTEVGVQTTYVVDEQSVQKLAHVTTGRITPDLIRAEVPDYLERLFYVSGPQPMVRSVRNMLLGMGVKRKAIKTDYFSGYA